MQRPIATLNLPEYKIKELHKRGFIFCDDVPIETIASAICVTKEEWETLTSSSSVVTKTALDLCEDESIQSNIISFSSVLDDLLGGGVPIKFITEFCGLPGTGKTQKCIQLCVSVQIPDTFGGVEGHAVYVDTNLGFTPKRVLDMAKGCLHHCNQIANSLNSFDMLHSLQQLSEAAILNHIHYIQLFTLSELLAFIHVFKSLIIKDPKIKLVVIDSITDPIKNSNLPYFERNKILYTFLSDLQQLASIHNFAIVVTNNMTTKFDSNVAYETPCLGDSFAHRVNNRVLFERKSDTFSATTLKSIFKPAMQVYFKITDSGIRNIDS